MDTFNILQFLENKFNEGSYEHAALLPNSRKT
jgi:hypothetical protein